MKHAVSIKRTMILNALSMLTSFAMFLGCTFAWYSDSVSSNVNRVESGLFRVNAYHHSWTSGAPDLTDVNAWTSIDAETTMFGNALNTTTALKLWEPGAMAVESFKIENGGELALKYQFNLVAAALNQVTWGPSSGNKYDLRDVIKVAIVDDVSTPTTREDIIGGNLTWNTLAEFLSQAQRTGVLMPKASSIGSDSDIFTVVMYWAPNDGDVDNHYNLLARNLGEHNLTVYGTPTNPTTQRLFLDVKVVVNATQNTVEADSFGTDYDAGADNTVVFAPLAVTINSTASTAIANSNITKNTGTETTYTAPVAATETQITDSSATSTIPADATLTLGEKIVSNAEPETAYSAPTSGTDTVTGLSRSIKTTENTSSSVTYDIGYKATVTTTTDTGTSIAEYAVHTFSDWVTNELNIGTGLEEVKVTHKGIAMTEQNEQITNFTGLNADAGYFYYNSTTGKLYIYSKTYSAYRVSWTEPDVMIVSSSGTSYMTLAKFRDSVNEGNTYAGATVTLIRNVNLSGAEWTPIGTNEHPFSGVFNGNNKTISGLTYSTTGNDAGFFGVIRGEDSSEFNHKFRTDFSEWNIEENGIWDSTNNALKNDADSEEIFKTIVKNLTLKNVNITAKKYAGALAGYTIDTYLSNIKVESGNVYATGNKVGGVVGSANGCTVLKQLVTGNNLTVTGDGHSVAGIVGSIQRKYNDNDHQTVSRTNTTHAILVEKCINDASVIWDQNGDYAGGSPIAGIVGNAGSIAEQMAVVIFKCRNNGTITAGKCSYAAGIVGQTSVQVKVICDCENTGAITADAYYDNPFGYVGGVAGIAISGNAEVINCSNTGELTNTHENGYSFQITSEYRTIRILSGTYDTVSALASAILSQYNDTCVNVVLKDVTVTNPTGTLTLPNTIQSITSNTKVCDSVDLNGSLTTVNMVGLNQQVAVDRTIIFGGSDNIITVAGGTTTGNIHLNGNNITFRNNGTMGVLTYSGTGTLTAENATNATMSGLYSAAGSASMTFTNRGTVSRTDWHTVGTETGGTLFVNNYGSIIGNTSGNSIHTLLFYGSCNVTFNAYNGSTVTGQFAPYSTTHTVQINYAAGTTMNDRPWTDFASSTYHVTVSQIS